MHNANLFFGIDIVLVYKPIFLLETKSLKLTLSLPK